MTTTIYSSCRHEPDLATSLTGLNLGGNSEIDTTSHPGLAVIVHPRWCRYCLTRREEEIRRQYNNRTVFPESANKEKTRQERQHKEYIRGVIEGRIRGLSSRLDSPINTGKPTTGQPTNGQLTTGQHNTGLNGQPHARDVVGGRLVAMMGTHRLTHYDEDWNQEQVEMEQFFQDYRHYRRGLKDGKRVQCQLELYALRIPDTKQREDLLEDALM